jgi:hypothetical protein
LFISARWSCTCQFRIILSRFHTFETWGCNLLCLPVWVKLIRG